MGQLQLSFSWEIIHLAVQLKKKKKTNIFFLWYAHVQENYSFSENFAYVLTE